MERRKKHLSPRRRLLLTRGLIKAGSADASLRWIVTGIVLATIMFILALMIPNLGETHDEWVEYNRLSSHHSPSNGAASPPLTEKAAPPISPRLMVPANSGWPGVVFGLHETGRGESLSGASPAPSSPYAELVNLAGKGSAPESTFVPSSLPPWAGAEKPQPPPSPVMDRLIPRRSQNRALGSAGDRQIENAREAERLLWARGYREPKAVIAMLANAWHESRWRADVVHREANGTVSRGMFQLTNGPLTVEGNVEMLTSREPYASRIAKWYANHKRFKWTAGESAFNFARHVEVCASRFWNERKATANTWWALLEKER